MEYHVRRLNRKVFDTVSRRWAFRTQFSSIQCGWVSVKSCSYQNIALFAQEATFAGALIYAVARGPKALCAKFMKIVAGMQFA